MRLKPADVELALAAVTEALGFPARDDLVARLRAALGQLEIQGPRLTGVREIAQAFGVSRQAVSNWSSWSSTTAHKGPGFPNELGRASGVPVYDMDQIEHWHSNRVIDKGGRRPASAA